MGAIITLNAGSNSTHWMVTVSSISGSENVAINSTYAAVWTAQGKLTIAPATLDKFRSQPSIDSRLRFFDHDNQYTLSAGDTLALNKTAFASGFTMKLLKVSGEEWYTMSQKSMGDASASQLDPLPQAPTDLSPQILAIALVTLAAISILITNLKWGKIMDEKNADGRMSPIIKWMPLAFMSAGVTLSVWGFYSFSPDSVGMMLHSFPSRSLLIFAIVIIAPILSWFAASYEYSKWKRDIATLWSFRSYLLLSLIVSGISFVTFEGFFNSGIGGPSC
jgi:hypothetical protein